MATQVNIHEAKTHFSKLLARVEAGEEIVIAKAGKPVAKLRRIKKQPARRVLGQDRGLFTVPPEFDDPLPELEEYT